MGQLLENFMKKENLHKMIEKGSKCILMLKVLDEKTFKEYFQNENVHDIGIKSLFILSRIYSKTRGAFI